MIISKSIRKGIPALLKKEIKAESLPVKIVYLHGSFAKGCERDGSDIDLAVLFDEKKYSKNPLKYFMAINEICGRLERELKRNIDISILNRESLSFCCNVIITGVPVYISSRTALHRYQNKIMGMFFEFRPFLEGYLVKYARI